MRETLVKTEDFKDSPLGKIPTDWEVLTFEDVSTVRQGLQIAISRRFKDYKPGRYIYITVEYLNNIANSNILEFIESPGNRVICQEDDVLVTRTGATGKIITGVEGVFHNNFFLVDYDRSKVNRHYLVYYLNLEQIQKEIKLRSGTTTIPDLKHRDFYSLTFLRPPLTEQEEIAVILKTCDEAIAHTSSLIAKLKQMKAGLLHDLLTRGLDENGELRDAIAHPEQFKDSPLGRIPKDWDVVTIGEACLLVKDGAHLPPKRVENGPLLLSVQNIINSRLQWSDSDTRISWDFYKSMHRNWEIQVGDVLLTIIGTIGRTAIVPRMPPFTLQRNVAVLRGKTSILDNLFLHHYLASEFFQKMVVGRGNKTAQPAIFLSDINLLKIPLPSLKEQNKIATVVEEYNTRIRTEEVYRDKLKLQKQGLMHDLLTGKVRVKNA